jgi:hypothetical protein
MHALGQPQFRDALQRFGRGGLARNQHLHLLAQGRR